MARELIAEAYPSANPAHRVVRDPAELDAAFAALGDMPLAIKPAGLTGGKGVKVMGSHLDSHADAHRYAQELLRSGPHPRAVVLEERVDALEFTIQAITDGTSCAFPPATFDYPYRFDGDSGPGIGGMGCYTNGAGPLPFMTQADYDEACEIIHAILARWKDRGRPFSGVLNTGFFLTDTGLKVIETNARFGDPEAMNIAALLQTDMTAVAAAVATGHLNELAVEFNDQISVVTYLVTPGYPQPGAGGLEFDFDVAAAARHGCVLHCAACEQIGTNRYRTVGASRVMALAALGSHLDDTHARVQQTIRDSFAGEPAAVAHRHRLTSLRRAPARRRRSPRRSAARRIDRRSPRIQPTTSLRRTGVTRARQRGRRAGATLPTRSGSRLSCRPGSADTRGSRCVGSVGGSLCRTIVSLQQSGGHRRDRLRSARMRYGVRPRCAGSARSSSAILRRVVARSRRC